MQPDFWHARWAANRIGFHEGRVNTLLEQHAEHLPTQPDSTIFVPLCGRAVDMLWLRERGARIIGSELSETAVREFFELADLHPTITQHGPLTAYEADGILIYAGDVFELSADQLGPVDATYDRAALVALPEDMRRRYAAHLVTLTNAAPQLLICFEYPEGAITPPPHSVPLDWVTTAYQDAYTICELTRGAITGNLKNEVSGQEYVCLLTPR